MSKSIPLKDRGREKVISLTPGDVERLYKLLVNLSDEDAKWSMAPYKREWVERWLNTPTLIQLAAEHSGELSAFVCIETWAHPKRRGTGYLGAYVHKDYCGSRLLSSIVGIILDEAKERGLHRVETEVVAESTSALSVLEEHGFQVEGRKKDCFFGSDGRYHDTLIMGKIIG